jgi:AcrR family transcriptional regulator
MAVAGARAHGPVDVSRQQGRRRAGGSQVSEVQRARLLRAAAAVIAERGFGEMSVGLVTRGARVSRRTFYDLFSDREDCFLALFELASERARACVREGYENEPGAWGVKVRAGVGALLGLLDDELALRRVLVLDALVAGPRVLECRACELDVLSSAIAGGAPRRLPGVIAEAVAGAVVGLLHTRLLRDEHGSLRGMVGELTGVIVLPYLGSGAAEREMRRRRPGPRGSRAAAVRGGGSVRGERGLLSGVVVSDPLADLPMRVTYRTLLVLHAIDAAPGASNREIGRGAGLSDQGQISKLLARLQSLRLIENRSAHNGRQPTGEPNAWHLTVRGAEVERATRTTKSSHEAK